MQNVPELCISVCGAAALVGAVLLGMIRMLRRAPQYVTLPEER